MNKKYSEKDLIRRPWVRTIIWGISLVMVVAGTKSYTIYSSWEGIVVFAWGLFLFFALTHAYENLLMEKND